MGAGSLGALAVVALVAACSQRGDPASPVPPEGGPFADVTVEDPDAGDGGDGPAFTFCPDSIDASFGSILDNLFAAPNPPVECIDICHTKDGAMKNGHLSFEDEAGAVYAELLGDGGGVQAANLMGSAKILRVAPFDPDASLLYIKLTLHTASDPLYGSGMPQSTPGSVCPTAVQAVHDWIASGAAYGAAVVTDAQASDD